MTIKQQTEYKLSDSQKEKLTKELRWLFKQFNLNVAVGLTKNGIMIGSQDERVDARNLGEVKIQKESI